MWSLRGEACHNARVGGLEEGGSPSPPGNARGSEGAAAALVRLHTFCKYSTLAKSENTFVAAMYSTIWDDLCGGTFEVIATRSQVVKNQIGSIALKAKKRSPVNKKIKKQKECPKRKYN